MRHSARLEAGQESAEVDSLTPNVPTEPSRKGQIDLTTTQQARRHGRQLTFLDLPAEIRILIYQLLLCQDEPMSGSWNTKLSPTILCTCRQILNEARPILYGENVWKIKIWQNGCGAERASFMETHHLGEYIDYRLQHRLPDMRRFNIVVEIQSKGDEDEVFSVRHALTKVSNVLSKLPHLDYLHIELCAHEQYGGDAQKFCQVLQIFTLLQHVRKVVFDGVPPVYAEYLRRKMTGSAPLDHLPNMYDALSFYAGPFEFCGNLLQEACHAMEESDVDRFKRVRAKIINLVSQHMANDIDHLYDHDAQGVMNGALRRQRFGPTEN